MIKWPGSKRSIAPIIARMLPRGGVYFEPFVGGGALLPFRACRKAIAGDIIPELIELWKLIRDEPHLTAAEYETRWIRLQEEGHRAYYAIRESFNATRSPHDLLFLTRTCVNGLARFNTWGNFNNSLHHTRPGIAPSNLRKVILSWSQIVRDVEFSIADYRRTLESVNKGDVVFLDPPYGGTKGRYMPHSMSYGDLCGELDRLNSIEALWILTLDGSAGDRSYATTIPASLYKARLSVRTGNSPFTKLMRAGIDSVTESVYFNFELPETRLGQLLELPQQERRPWDGLNMQDCTLFGANELQAQCNVNAALR